MMAGAMLVWAVAVGAKEPAYERMTFREHRSCQDPGCSRFLLAQGAMDEGDEKALEQALDAPNAPNVVVFDSPGGSMVTGLRIGQILRERGVDTRLVDRVMGENGVLVDRPVCLSACVYAFMGGVNRTVEPNALIGVHQFRAKNDADASQASAQRAMAILGVYVERMGVDRRILDVAALTSSDSIERINAQEAVELKLDNQARPFKGWQIRATDSGVLMLSGVRQQNGRSTAVVVRLMRSEKDPTLMLVMVARSFLERDERGGTMDALAASFNAGLSGGSVCLGATRSCVPMVQAKPWEAVPKEHAVAAFFVVEASAFERRANGEGFEVVFQGSPTTVAIGPDVVFGGEGLDAGLAALARRP